jgi:hypothetical protein
MNNNVPLIIGMSPSTKPEFSDTAFASGARTTRALIKAVSEREDDEAGFRAQFDYVNLDMLRKAGSRAFLDQAEALTTLSELLRLGQREERVLVLLGKDVCAAVSKWFDQPTFERPGISTAVHEDGWSCTVCAVDHPGWYDYKSKIDRAKHEDVIRRALKLHCYPTRAEFQRAYHDDYVEAQWIEEYDSFAQDELHEIESLASEEIREEDEREFQQLRDYYSHPTYDPDDYE